MSNERVDRAIEDITALYERGLEEHGLDPKAVGWRDEAEQELRFSQLARVIGAFEGPISAIDYGCGYGALFDFFDAGGVSLASYDGYDVSGEMVEQARSRVGDGRARFVKGRRVDRDADFVFVSGTFNVRSAASDADWEEFIHATLRDLFARSRRGLAFNLLSTYVDWRESHLFYGDPKAFFDFCKTELSPAVTLIHDYPLYEWTMLVQRR